MKCEVQQPNHEELANRADSERTLDEINEVEQEVSPTDLLAQILEKKKHDPDMTDESVLAHEREMERIIEENEIHTVLEFFDFGDVSVEVVNEEVLKIQLQKTKPEALNLPKGYAYKGGMARAVIQRELGIDPRMKSRDKDLVKITTHDNKDEEERLARIFTPDDFEDMEQGYENETGRSAIEELKSDYFKTHDFTINELLATDDALYFTFDCLIDTIRGIIRFTDYEINKGGASVVSGKLMAKAVRLAAGEAVRGNELEIANETIFECSYIDDFEVAIHLDRAFQQGIDVAVEYMRKLIETNKFQGDTNNPKIEIAKFVRWFESCAQGDFLFRYAPQSIFYSEEALLSDDHKDVEGYENLPKMENIKQRT